MPLPHTISPDHFDEVFRLAPNAWADVVYELARSLGLPQAELQTFPDGSNLLAALGPHILKIFPPFHRHQWESERRALAALRGRVSVRIPTLWANTLVLWGMALALAMALYFELFPRLLRLIPSKGGR